MVARFGAKSYDVFTPEGGESIIIIKDEDGEIAVQGTVHQLIEAIHQSDIELYQARLLPIAPELMKVRGRIFTRRMPVRAIKDFEFNGVEYKAGEIFDYVALGLKRYNVQKLFNIRVIRHIVQDSRLRYPFRAPDKIQIPENLITKDSSDAPAPEDNSEEVKKRGEQAEVAASKGLKFTRANEHLKG